MVVEYRLITNLAKKEWVLLEKTNINYVPEVSSIVNIDGDPFLVYSVSSVIGYEVYIYVEVFKAGTYDLVLNGIKY